MKECITRRVAGVVSAGALCIGATSCSGGESSRTPDNPITDRVRAAASRLIEIYNDTKDPKKSTSTVINKQQEPGKNILSVRVPALNGAVAESITYIGKVKDKPSTDDVTAIDVQKTGDDKFTIDLTQQKDGSWAITYNQHTQTDRNNLVETDAKGEIIDRRTIAILDDIDYADAVIATNANPDTKAYDVLPPPYGVTR